MNSWRRQYYLYVHSIHAVILLIVVLDIQKLCPLNSFSSQWWFKFTNDSLRFWSECPDQDSATSTLIPWLTDRFYEFRSWELVLCVEACLNSHQLYMNLWVKSTNCYVSFTPTPAVRRPTVCMFLDSIWSIGARSHILCGWNNNQCYGRNTGIINPEIFNIPELYLRSRCFPLKFDLPPTGQMRRGF